MRTEFKCPECGHELSYDGEDVWCGYGPCPNDYVGRDATLLDAAHNLVYQVESGPLVQEMKRLLQFGPCPEAQQLIELAIEAQLQGKMPDLNQLQP